MRARERAKHVTGGVFWAGLQPIRTRSRAGSRPAALKDALGRIRRQRLRFPPLNVLLAPPACPKSPIQETRRQRRLFFLRASLLLPAPKLPCPFSFSWDV
jgi:hypothetical protein